MTNIENDLIKRDLCYRLPYNVKVHAKYNDLGETIEIDGIVKMIDADGVVGIEVIDDFSSAWTYVHIDNVKPYLFPVDSMTDEQKEEWKSLVIQEAFGKSDGTLTVQDFYNMNYIDCRGLIPKGLAKDATNLNVY